MLARGVWSVALAAVSACVPSFDGLSGGAVQRDSSAEARDDAALTAGDSSGSGTDGANDASAESDAANTDVTDALGEPADTPFPLPPDAPGLGLYFYWPFESGSTKIADDVSGNRRNGVLSNVITSTDQAPTARPGNLRAVKLEDAQSSISCLADVPVESYTISMWVKPASGSSKLVVSRMDTASNTLLMQLRITGTGVFEHYVNDGSSGAGCQQSEVGSCTTGTTAIKGSQWYHVAVTAKSRSEMHLYVNGFEEGTSRTLMQFQNTGDRYDFGYESGRATGGFQGVIDEIIVYDWVLPPSDINKLAAPL